MSITKATEHDVWAAADALESEGIPVTSRALISRVGGSTSTILKHLQSWRARQKQPSTVPPIPEALGPRISSISIQIWAEAWNIAAAEIEAVKDKAITSAEAAQAEIREAVDECARLESDLAQAQGQLASSLERVRTLELSLERATEEGRRAVSLEAQLTESRQAAIAAIASSARLDGQAEALTQQLTAALARQTELAASHASAMGDLARERARADAAERRLVEAAKATSQRPTLSLPKQTASQSAASKNGADASGAAIPPNGNAR